ncbi:MAG TPA: DNA polymerase IV [Bacilli bacterium]|nr:DNA polymerase IV [Bacilli bacterium]
MTKIILHIDLNSFFPSCEILRDPSLKDKTLVVGGLGRRGIVSSATYEARAYGIHSAMSIYQALKLYPNLIIKEPDFALYRHYSTVFFDFIKKNVSEIVEVASIDECYVDATVPLLAAEKPLEYIKNLQDTLLNEIGLPCSIGVGPTKFLAKMASNFKKPLGITVYRRRELKDTLWKLPIGEMYGIGKKTTPRLEKLGIKTIGDIAVTEDYRVKEVLGKFYDTVKEWANGYGSDVVQVDDDDPKSIGNSQTFDIDTSDYDELASLFKELAKTVSKRAKNERKAGTTIQIVMRYYDFRTVNRSVTFEKPTNDASLIYSRAMQLFERNYKHEPIRLLGITLQNLVDIADIREQLSLFDDFNVKSKTDVIVDLLNDELDSPSLSTLGKVTKGKK